MGKKSLEKELASQKALVKKLKKKLKKLEPVDALGNLTISPLAP